MPVVVFPIASIGVLNAVSKREVLSRTSSGICKSSRRSAVIDRQISPRPKRARKLIASGVTFSAAIVRSPSFSRPSSSTTMMILPARNAAMASSIRANGPVLLLAPLAILIGDDFFRFIPLMSDLSRPDARQRQSGQLRGAYDVFADHVDLEIDAIAQFGAPQV